MPIKQMIVINMIADSQFRYYCYLYVNQNYIFIIHFFIVVCHFEFIIIYHILFSNLFTFNLAIYLSFYILLIMLIVIFSSRLNTIPHSTGVRIKLPSHPSTVFQPLFSGHRLQLFPGIVHNCNWLTARGWLVEAGGMWPTIASATSLSS